MMNFCAQLWYFMSNMIMPYMYATLVSFLQSPVLIIGEFGI